MQTKVANRFIRSSVVGIDRIGMPRVTSHSSVTSDDGNDLWYLPTKGPRRSHLKKENKEEDWKLASSNAADEPKPECNNTLK